MFCWTVDWVQRNATPALEQARRVHSIRDDPQRLSLQLTFADKGVLQVVAWRWVGLPGIPQDMLPELHAEADQLRRIAVAQAKTGK